MQKEGNGKERKVRDKQTDTQSIDVCLQASLSFFQSQALLLEYQLDKIE